jgi:ribose transport system substrate-binding protein
MSLNRILLASAAVLILAAPTSAKELNKIGISLGSMGNPFFVALAKGAETEAKKINPNAEVMTFGYEFDIGKQFTQIDNFIASGVDLILLNPADAKAVGPAIKKAQDAGIVVVAVDTFADGADAVVQTNNTQAGEIACQYIVDQLNGKGDVVIINAPQVSSVVERVKGCLEVFAKAEGINVLSSDQDGKGSRDGGMNVMQGMLTRYDHIDAVFAINDPQAIGADLASRQQGREGMIITAVDGAPDAEAALKDEKALQFKASATQDPFAMAQLAVRAGAAILAGDAPAEQTQLLDSALVTRDNVGEYVGWASERAE